MAMINDNNYFNIAGWMVTKLGLKGTELMVFAIIYGFSQAEGNEFTASRKYLAEFTGASSMRTIDNCLSALLEKGYIIKRIEMINNVQFNRYKVNSEVIEEICTPCAKNATPPVQKLHPIINNINKNIYTNKSNNSNIQKESIGEIGEESLTLIDDLTRIYPKKGFTFVDAQIAIFNAIEREIDKGMTETEAVETIRRGTTAYINAVKKWKPKEKKFITNIKNFFNNSMYLENEQIWEREEDEHNDRIDLYVPKN